MLHRKNKVQTVSNPSLKILLSVICFFISMVCHLSRTQATPSASAGSPYVMVPVVVSATRSPLDKQDAAANITVISAEDLEKLPATTMAQVLSYFPGVTVQPNGGLGSDAGAVRIQGSEVRHVAIYQDGVPLNQLLNPRTDLSYLPLGSVERIEIYKGAASSAWGSALGGVINIITKAPEDREPLSMHAQASYGTYRTFRGRADVSGTPGKFGWLVSTTYERSDGFIEHTEYEQDAVYAKVNYSLNNEGRLGLVVSHDSGRNGDPVLNDPNFWDDMQRRTSYQCLQYAAPVGSDVMLTFEGYHRWFESNIDDVYPDHRESYSDYQDELWGGSARLSWTATQSNALVAGLDGGWGRFQWDDFSGTRRTDYTGNWAAYLNDTHTHRAAALSAGLRYDHNQDFGSTISPSVGATYRFADVDTLIRVQIAKGFSAPDPSWVHDKTYGNPDLRPEVAWNYQVGTEVRPLPWLELDVNLFRSDVKDLIRYEGDNTMRFQKIERVTRQGVEWSLNTSFANGLTAKLGGAYTEVRDDTTDTVIKDIPCRQYNMMLFYTGPKASHSLIGRYIDHNSSYAETRDSVFVFDYLFRLNLSRGGEKSRWQLYGAIYNLFDSDYLYRTVWPQPGRWGEIGLRFQ